MNDPYFNSLFTKIKFGLILSELFKLQFEIISLFLNQENIDISILNNYMIEDKISKGLFDGMMHLPKKYDDIKMQCIQNDVINF